jgi:NADH dehydrogenase (ubiquinone) 1 beta subcomplex subunit 6
MVASSDTGGVKAFPIGGRMVSERERCIGMTDEERAWRKQYLKDQILSKNEPRYVEAYWKERTNPIRRFYMFPLDQLHKALTPVLVSAIFFCLQKIQ